VHPIASLLKGEAVPSVDLSFRDTLIYLDPREEIPGFRGQPMNEDGGSEHGGAREPDDHSAADGTLGGYMEHHNRPPAFEGADGYPYTVSPEVEKTPDLRTPFAGYLVFPRWAQTGAGIVGHVETPILLRGKTRGDVESRLKAMTLAEVSDFLGEAIATRQRGTE
jgi:hypothetical protein